jgi:tetratricopeptide (TPR) repeat protein
MDTQGAVAADTAFETGFSILSAHCKGQLNAPDTLESALNSFTLAYERIEPTDPQLSMLESALSACHFLMGNLEKSITFRSCAEESFKKSGKAQKSAGILYGLRLANTLQQKKWFKAYVQLLFLWMLPFPLLTTTLCQVAMSSQVQNQGLWGTFWKQLISGSIGFLEAFYSPKQTFWRWQCQWMQPLFFLRQKTCLSKETAFRHVMTSLKALTSCYPNDWQALLMMGDLYLQEDLTTLAYAAYQKALKQNPLSLEALKKLGDLAFQHEHYEEALDYYKPLNRLVPMQASTHYQLANTYLAVENVSQALSHFLAALSCVEALRTERLLKEDILKELGNLYKTEFNQPLAAIHAFKQAWHCNPENSYYPVQLGLLYYEMDDFLNTEITYEKALRLFPSHPLLHTNLGYVYWNTHKADKAIRCFEQAIALKKDYPIPYNNLGVIYLDTLGQPKQAIPYFQKAIELNPCYALGFYNLGRAYFLSGDFEKAWQQFDKAQSLNEYTQEVDPKVLSQQIYEYFDFQST